MQLCKQSRHCFSLTVQGQFSENGALLKIWWAKSPSLDFWSLLSGHVPKSGNCTRTWILPLSCSPAWFSLQQTNPQIVCEAVTAQGKCSYISPLWSSQGTRFRLPGRCPSRVEAHVSPPSDWGISWLHSPLTIQEGSFCLLFRDGTQCNYCAF